MGLRNISFSNQKATNLSTIEETTTKNPSKNILNKSVTFLTHAQKKTAEILVNNKGRVVALAALLVLGYFTKISIEYIPGNAKNGNSLSEIEPSICDVPKYVGKALNYEIKGYSIANAAATISSKIQENSPINAEQVKEAIEFMRPGLNVLDKSHRFMMDQSWKGLAITPFVVLWETSKNFVYSVGLVTNVVKSSPTLLYNFVYFKSCSMMYTVGSVVLRIIGQTAQFYNNNFHFPEIIPTH